MSPRCKPSNCAEVSGRCCTISRRSFGGFAAVGFGSITTLSLARHCRNWNGPDPALLPDLSHALPKSSPTAFAITVFLSTTLPTSADRQ